MKIIETERLILRNFLPQDLDILWDYRRNPLCSRYQRGQSSDRSELDAMIRAHAHDSLSMEQKVCFAVADAQDVLVGDLTLYLEDPETITMGYTVSYAHHRKGYASEIISALLPLLHHRYPEREVICLVDPDNEASIGLLRKLGFSDLGYAPKITSQVFGMWEKV